MSEQPIHDWMLPRLQKLLDEAAQAGFARAPCVAVIADLMASAAFNDAPLPTEPPGPAGQPGVPPITQEFDAPSLGPDGVDQPDRADLTVPHQAGELAFISPHNTLTRSKTLAGVATCDP